MPCFENPIGDFGPGHLMHWIHAKLLGRNPHGWLDAVVRRVAVDPTGTVLDLGLLDGERPEDTDVTVWHHQDLSGALGVGDPVRVHLALHALGWPGGWINVRVDHRPDSIDPALLRVVLTGSGPSTPAIVSVATGRGVATDHTGHDSGVDDRLDP